MLSLPFNTQRTKLRHSLAVLSLVTLSAAGCSSEPAAPGRLGSLGEFSFKDQRGAQVSSQTLRGKPVVLNFIFSRCPDRCPIFTARFANLQRKLESHDEVEFVSVTVDPDYDTPDVLAAYAGQYDADPAHWHFLTGTLDGMKRSVLDAFMKHLDGRDIQGEPDLMEIVHGELFLLVDGKGDIRGFFGSDEHSFERLERAIEQLDKSA